MDRRIPLTNAASAILFSLLVLAVWALPGQTAQAAVKDELQYMFQDGIAAPGTEDDDERLIQVFTYYEERSFKPLFVRDNGPKTKGKVLLQILKAAADEGLDPSRYRVAEIEERLSSLEPVKLAEAELLLARAMIDYGRDISAGRVEPRNVDRELFIYPKGPGPLTLLDGAEQADNMGPYIASLAPQTPNYARLKATLAKYREMAANGGWTQVPAGDALKPGMQDPRIVALRARLEQSGDLAPGAHVGDTYDGALVEGVKRFQRLHGIDQDGVVGPDTLRQMNITVADRVKTLELNMERRRWMEDDLGERYIFVNLADQFLKVVDNGKTVHEALTVVGKTYFRTPVFSKNMKYIVINPYWNVPPSIARNEYLPKLRRNPGVLYRENIKILKGNTVIDPYRVNWSSISGRFPFRLRQEPGPKNALGKIKFMFPNQFNVYIHDTPSKSLFSRATRVFSHGCIRVQNPGDLGAVLLSTQGWTQTKFDSAFKSNKRRVVRLKKEIPVHITYLTAWTNKDGTVHFRKDVYGRDKRLAAALSKAY